MYNVTAHHARGVARSVAWPVNSCMMPAMTVGETLPLRAAIEDLGVTR